MSNINDALKMKGRLQIHLNDELVQEVDNLVVTAAGASDTALGSQLGRVALTSTNVSAAVVTYVATFAAGTGTGAVTEAAILNASSGGTMLCRTVFSVVNKGASDSMTVTWTVTVS